MAKKHISIILVPHSKTSCRTYNFSQKTLKVLTWGGGFLAVVFLALLVDYISMNGLRHKYKELSRMTAEQSEKITNYEQSISRLQTAVAQFEEYAKKLNVMAGLKSPDVLAGPAGVGSGPNDENGGEYDSGNGDSYVSWNSVQALGQKAMSVEGNLSTLMKFFEGESLRLASTPTIKPAAGWLASTFGYRNDPFTGKWTMHRGVDISTNVGNPIFATADGIVLKVLSDKILGNYVMIGHGFGYTTLYGHMSKFAVKTGQRVKRGEVIGYIGQTGKAVGPHVHYEVRVDGKPVNPYRYFLEE